MRNLSTRQPVEGETRRTDWSNGWAASGLPSKPGGLSPGVRVSPADAALTTGEDTTVLWGAGTTGRRRFSTGSRSRLLRLPGRALVVRRLPAGLFGDRATARLDAHQPFADRPQRKLRTRREPKLFENV